MSAGSCSLLKCQYATLFVKHPSVQLELIWSIPWEQSCSLMTSSVSIQSLCTRLLVYWTIGIERTGQLGLLTLGFPIMAIIQYLCRFPIKPTPGISDKDI